MRQALPKGDKGLGTSHPGFASRGIHLFRPKAYLKQSANEILYNYIILECHEHTIHLVRRFVWEPEVSFK
jgi:hypothetical protein